MRTQLKRWFFIGGMAGLAACSNGDDGEPDTTPDPDASEDTRPDVPPPAPGSVELGELCDQDAWCQSGFCVKIGNGYNEGVCSKRCEETDDCDDETWECRTMTTESSDDISACVPKDLCIDKDGDGYGIGPGCLGPDCDDDDPQTYFGAPERCNGKDNDCNGIIDDNPVDDGINCDTGELGVCADGRTQCNTGVLSCIRLTEPSQEICDGFDNDCDGLIDEPEGLDKNDNFVTRLHTACEIDTPACLNGRFECHPDLGGTICVLASPDGTELCNGIDDDCDGIIDNGIPKLGEVCEVGDGVCRRTDVRVCDPADSYAEPICNVEPNWANKTDEICDYIDNDCDGTIDAPYKDEDGRYAFVETCGSCTTNCNAQWGDTKPSAVHATPNCDTSEDPPVCGFNCTDGYVDVDGVQENGCELLPDEQAVYTTTIAKGGADTATCGSYDFPCATIAHAITRAQGDSKKNIRLSEGIFREGVTVVDGISILGGHSSVNWLRDIDLNTTTIYGAVATFSDDKVAVLAKNIQTATELSGLNIVSLDALQNGNSIAMMIDNAGSKLIVKDNLLQAGFGGQGANGSRGGDGTKGGDGSNGKTGKKESSCPSAARAGGASGVSQCDAASGSSQLNVSGGKGADGICPIYDSGGQTPGTGNTVANQSGSGGQPGLTGTTRGANGTTCTPPASQVDKNFSSDGRFGGGGGNGAAPAPVANTSGTLTTSGLWRAAAGQQGAAGKPGGGGGGGGAHSGLVECTGGVGTNGKMTGCTGAVYLAPTGGGGGGGGCGGKGADGGNGGGGSFGLYLHYDSSASTLPTIKDNTIVRGIGGAGGPGGIGGSGGYGGAGGDGGPASWDGQTGSTWSHCIGSGRRGGDGGRGGHGAGGGGGVGGNSFDIFESNLSSSQRTQLKNQNNFSVPESTDTYGGPGQGGGAIGHPGPDGAPGVSGRLMSAP